MARKTHLIISIRILNMLSNEAYALNSCEHFRCERSWDDNLFTLCEEKRRNCSEKCDRQHEKEIFAWMVMLMRMAHHIIVSIVVILVLIRIFSDAISVVISEKLRDFRSRLK